MLTNGAAKSHFRDLRKHRGKIYPAVGMLGCPKRAQGYLLCCLQAGLCPPSPTPHFGPLPDVHFDFSPEYPPP